jgi:hypothetical protein
MRQFANKDRHNFIHYFLKLEGIQLWLHSKSNLNFLMQRKNY